MLCLSGFELYSRWVPLTLEIEDSGRCEEVAVSVGSIVCLLGAFA